MKSPDVIITGAGFTGLAAASRLRRHGVSCLVLEADDRVGGRVEASRNGLGELTDTGGQFLCDDMPNVMALARRFGKTLVETALEGCMVAQPPMRPDDAECLMARSTAIRDRVNAYDPNDPAIAGVTVAQWLDGQPDSSDVKAAFRAMIEGLWCIELGSLPLWYLASNDRRITNDVPEMQYFLAESMHSLAGDLAGELDEVIRLETAVTSVERSAGGVRVTALTDGEEHSFRASAALIAVPPATASKLDYAPSLPDDLASALSAWRSGMVIKVLVRYDRAVWRDDGRSGMVVWRAPSSLFAFDTSPAADQPMLTVFVGGPLAQAWHALDEASLCANVKMNLVAALGGPAGAPLDMQVRDWTDDPWSGGAYSDVIVDMAAKSAEGVFRKGWPPLYFAASEVSPSFAGYIEGALVAGRIAADTIIADLENRQSPIATSASGS